MKKETAHNYGCIVSDADSLVLHYVEKPETYISNMVNGGIYLFNTSLFDEIKVAMDEKATRAAYVLFQHAGVSR